MPIFSRILSKVCGEVEALRALLAAGADVTITDLNGGSPVRIFFF